MSCGFCLYQPRGIRKGLLHPWQWGLRFIVYEAQEIDRGLGAASMVSLRGGHIGGRGWRAGEIGTGAPPARYIEETKSTERPSYRKLVLLFPYSTSFLIVTIRFENNFNTQNPLRIRQMAR